MEGKYRRWLLAKVPRMGLDMLANISTVSPYKISAKLQKEK